MLAILVKLKRYVRHQLSTQNLTTEDKENDASMDQGQKKRRKLYKMRQSSEFEMEPDEAVIPEADFVQVTRKPRGTEDSQDEEEFHSSLSDPLVVAGLLDIVCIIWMTRSREIAKPQHDDYRTLLEKKSTIMLTYLFKYYKTEDCVCRPLVYISSFVPHASAQMTAGFCLSKIRNYDSDGEPFQGLSNMDAQWAGTQSPPLFETNNPISTYLDSLCNWKRGDSVLEMVGEWIKKGKPNIHIYTLS